MKGNESLDEGCPTSWAAIGRHRYICRRANDEEEENEEIGRISWSTGFSIRRKHESVLGRVWQLTDRAREGRNERRRWSLAETNGAVILKRLKGKNKKITGRTTSRHEVRKELWLAAGRAIRFTLAAMTRSPLLLPKLWIHNLFAAVVVYHRFWAARHLLADVKLPSPSIAVKLFQNYSSAESFYFFRINKRFSVITSVIVVVNIHFF